MGLLAAILGHRAVPLYGAGRRATGIAPRGGPQAHNSGITAAVSDQPAEEHTTMTRIHREDPIALHRLAKFTFRRYQTAKARREMERADQLFQVLDRVNRLGRMAGSSPTLPSLPQGLVRK